MSLLAGCAALVLATVIIMFVTSPFTGGIDLSDWGTRGTTKADPVCIAAWNASGPHEFLSGYSSSAIVERLDGDCLISTGLDGYVLRAKRWEKVQKAPYSWHNARHGTDGILTATDEPWRRG